MQSLIGMMVFLLVFFGICTMGYVLIVRPARDLRRALSRLRNLADEPMRELPTSHAVDKWAWVTLPRCVALFLSKEKKSVADLQSKLLRAGYFRTNAALLFVGVRLLLMAILSTAFGLFIFWTGLVAPARIPFVALLGCAVGMIGPSFWLDAQVSKRQRLLRNALPDALDMLVLCMEGGISLSAALQRVTDELKAAHPILALEMNIVQREVELGLSPGAAFKKFADRCGLADIRDLASTLQQSERFGASITKALRIYAEGARADRQMRAEETAQKAAVKILFPTLFCIFPAIFIVLLGPAAFQLAPLFIRKH
jgi:tight adherence protein C